MKNNLVSFICGNRAANLFGCPEVEFLHLDTKDRTNAHNNIEAWSGDELPLNIGTLEMLPKLRPRIKREKRSAIFGIITCDIRRIVPLLDDLRAATESQDSDFDPFVVVFVNTVNAELAKAVESEVNKRRLRGHVFSRSSSVVESILLQCNDVVLPKSDDNLPIAISRTVLQGKLFDQFPL